ncbi:hypothetical protein N7528_004139 [Penicillium herquei]|nr:hypothetical protein N7528_004139 [Penicillium herquei]
MTEHPQRPYRVLVIISKRSAYWEQAWSATEEIMLPVVKLLQDKNLLQPTIDNNPPELRLLAKQRRLHVFFVFDIANTAYDFAEAHLPKQNQLPVLIVRMSSRNHGYSANPAQRNEINNRIAEIHNHEGWNSFPPFAVDYTVGPPTYMNPRNLKTRPF